MADQQSGNLSDTALAAARQAAQGIGTFGGATKDTLTAVAKNPLVDKGLGAAESVAQWGALFGMVNNGTADSLLAAESFKDYMAGKNDLPKTAGRMVNALVDYKVFAAMEESGSSPFFSKIVAWAASKAAETVVEFISSKIGSGELTKDSPLDAVVQAAKKQFGIPSEAVEPTAPSSGLPPQPSSGGATRVASAK